MVKNRICFFAVLAVLAVSAGAAWAQVPDGRDIATAIPYYFGQVATGIGDKQSQPRVVYSINLAKGQNITVAANITAGDKAFQPVLLTSAALTVSSAPQSAYAFDYGSAVTGATFNYLAPASGTYYIVVFFLGSGQGYQMTAKSQGTPIAVPNPPTAGCVNGPVDYITYSLQLIAANLPDEASIGGTKLCSSCSVKPPTYPEILRKMEFAMNSNMSVSACYDSTGSIFQIKVARQ